jgi:DNA invertase Pin-like site-specific DNA recombinase
MIDKPGEAGELSEHLLRHNQGGRPAVTDKHNKVRQAVEMRREGISLREIAKAVRVSKTTVERWLFDYDASQRCPAAGQFRDAAVPDGEAPN